MVICGGGGDDDDVGRTVSVEKKNKIVIKTV